MIYTGEDYLTELARVLVKELCNKGWKKKDIAEKLGLSYGGLQSMMTDYPVHVYTLEILLEMTGKELVVKHEQR